VRGAIARAAEHRLRPLAERQLHLLGPDDRPGRDDLRPPLGPLARPVQRPPEGHARRLAGRKPRSDDGQPLARLDLARRHVEHLHELRRRQPATPVAAAGEPRDDERQQDRRQPAKASHRPANGRTPGGSGSK
jgi:hypothetical protein